MSKRKHQGRYGVKGQEMLSDIEAIAAQAILSSAGEHITSDTAKHIAHELAFQLSNNWGGQVLYMPKSPDWIATARDLAIFNQFKGNNHGELAEKFNLSVPYIYEILRRIRASRPKDQQDLFDDFSG